MEVRRREDVWASLLDYLEELSWSVLDLGTEGGRRRWSTPPRLDGSEAYIPAFQYISLGITSYFAATKALAKNNPINEVCCCFICTVLSYCMYLLER
jgi:hypothetical protein